jgi:hypothetical protein
MRDLQIGTESSVVDKHELSREEISQAVDALRARFEGR